MSKRFEYKPRFVDIRVRPPKDAQADHLARRGEKTCDQPGCPNKAACPAPKSPHLLDSPDRFWFCYAHAVDYNKRWDFFSGMSPTQIERFQAEARVGHRPTWDMKASRHSREAAAKMRGQYSDPLGTMGADPTRPEAAPAPSGRTPGRLEQKALEDLGLGTNAGPDEIRARYTQLLKRYHPDANGGDRSAESRLHSVIKAYKILKSSGLAKPHSSHHKPQG